MTPAQLASYVRLKTRTNVSTFPDADILLYANIMKDDIAKEITKTNEDYFGMELFKDLVAGQRSYGLPRDVLNQIKYAQVKLDGEKWRKLSEFDINSYGKTTDEATILASWSGKEPSFDIFGDQFTIYSDDAIISVSQGLQLWAIVYPQDLTNLSLTTDISYPDNDTSFGLPTEFHKILATKIIVEYKTSKEKSIPLTENEQSIDKELMMAINSLKLRNLDRSLTATIPYNDGQDY